VYNRNACSGAAEWFVCGTLIWLGGSVTVQEVPLLVLVVSVSSKKQNDWKQKQKLECRNLLFLFFSSTCSARRFNASAKLFVVDDLIPDNDEFDGVGQLNDIWKNSMNISCFYVVVVFW